MTWSLSRRVWALLALATVLEGFSAAAVLAPMMTVGFVALPWSILPVALATPALLRSRVPLTPRQLVAGVVLMVLGLVSAVGFAANAGAGVTVALLLSAHLEESIFRIGLPGLLALGLISLGVRKLVAVIAALVASGFCFAILPGHLMQMTEAPMMLVFLAFAFLMSYAVWRGAMLWPAVVAHATINFLTFGVQASVFSDAQRATGVIVALASMAVMAMDSALHPAAAAPGDAATNEVIDLRELEGAQRVGAGGQRFGASGDLGAVGARGLGVTSNSHGSSGGA